jgi:hypothetical protein
MRHDNAWMLNEVAASLEAASNGDDDNGSHEHQHHHREDKS